MDNYTTPEDMNKFAEENVKPMTTYAQELATQIYSFSDTLSNDNHQKHFLMWQVSTMILSAAVGLMVKDRVKGVYSKKIIDNVLEVTCKQVRETSLDYLNRRK